ncbi:MULTISPECIES: hypothetical protein [unclassified Pseudomonas]|uniref:hypothetical protein n=1 Tax=unclassified Pseudomonas TaxID=196821 RepID=UPI000EAA29BF|nr:MULTISPECIES: hypothetical protein [unclassified Pseudomonas]AYF86241.1 hypothetical protein D6Z43_03275 [Pseudomonas sp. DY-1]MDH4653355.1 hypothetical protein [Pseudomonas sp. BN606]MRK20686.1 hypothetical protein [Pseudomonas sp. JG-B]
MPVRLDKVPPRAAVPASPRAWIWLLLLPSLSVLGLGMTLWLGGESLTQQPAKFWRIALGVPFLVWCVLGFLRALVYVGMLSVADGWDEARKQDLVQKMRRGRRSLQVLGVSLHTALRPAEDLDGVGQMDAICRDAQALKVQASWQGSAVRHSRLSRIADESPEQILLRVLPPVLAELASVLAGLSEGRPLAYLLEIDSALPRHELQRIWLHLWLESGIRQPLTPVKGSGLDAVDRWLDQRIGDEALMLVVAIQIAPAQPEGTAEAVVGLLFGNRLTQATLEPRAYLYRPEQERKPTAEDLDYAVRQALEWAKAEASAIQDVWLTGIDAKRQRALGTVRDALSIPAKQGQGLHDLDATLGYPGRAAPWVAIATAVEAIQGKEGKGQPQLIFSGDGAAETGLWSTVVMPVLPASK